MTGLLDSPLTPEEQKFFDTRGESGLPEPTDPPAPSPPPPAAPGDGAPGSAAPPAPAPGATPPSEPSAPGATPPAAAADDDDDDGGEPAAIDPKTGKQPPRRVPYRKFKAIEDELAALKGTLGSRDARVQELETMMARADERMKIINEALAAPTAEQQAAEDDDPRPDPREDVFAYMEWQERHNGRLMQRLEEQITGLTTRTEEDFSNRRQQTEMQGFESRYRNDANVYAQTNPKFAHAYAYLMGMRDRQYAALGIKDANQRMARIVGEERDIISNAYRNNLNPAQQIYDLALASGFNPDAVAAAPPTPGGGAAPAPGGNGAAPPPAAGGAPAPGVGAAPPAPQNVAAVIEAVRSGQEASTSLSAGGGVPADRLTPEVLANMTDEQFAAVMERLPKHRIRELLPGA